MIKGWGATWESWGLRKLFEPVDLVSAGEVLERYAVGVCNPEEKRRDSGGVLHEDSPANRGPRQACIVALGILSRVCLT